MTTSLMFFELMRVVCQLKITPHTRNKRKLNCVKAIFILIGTAQPLWSKVRLDCHLSLAERPTLTKCFTGLNRSLTCCAENEGEPCPIMAIPYTRAKIMFSNSPGHR